MVSQLIWGKYDDYRMPEMWWYRWLPEIWRQRHTKNRVINYDQQGSERSSVTFDNKQLAREYSKGMEDQGHRTKLMGKDAKYITYVYLNDKNGEFIPDDDLSKKVNVDLE